MTYVAILVMMLAAFAIAGWPLLSSVRQKRLLAGGVSAVDELLSRRDSAYNAIKELDFEYELGNLSQPDYQDLRDRYRARAAAVLQELEETMARTGTQTAEGGGAQTADGPRPCSTCSSPTEQGDEYCWSCGTRLEGGCPSCGRAIDPGDSFCAFCGTRLEARA